MGFEGMGRNPHDRRGKAIPLRRKEPSTEELEDIRGKLEAWDRVKQTPAGDAIYSLAGPVMAWLDKTMRATTIDLLNCGYPFESHDLIRAECRGAYWEWHRLLHEPMSLLDRLSELSDDKKTPPEDTGAEDVVDTENLP